MYIYISVNRIAFYQRYGRYTLYTFVCVNKFITLLLAILLLFIFRIRQCNLHVKLLLTSTFAASCSAIPQLTICGLTQCTVGCTRSTSHVLSLYAFDSLTLNFSYTWTTTEFNMRRYFVELYSYICGLCRSVRIETVYGLEGPGSNPGGDQIFRPSTPALGPTQPSVIWVPCLSWGLSAAGACCWPLTPSSAAFMEE